MARFFLYQLTSINKTFSYSGLGPFSYNSAKMHRYQASCNPSEKLQWCYNIQFHTKAY